MFNLIRGGPLQIVLSQVANICNEFMRPSKALRKQKRKAKRSTFSLPILTLGRLSRSSFRQPPASIGASGTLIPGLSESESLDAVQSSIPK